jgi:hypothetical protein
MDLRGFPAKDGVGLDLRHQRLECGRRESYDMTVWLLLSTHAMRSLLRLRLSLDTRSHDRVRLGMQGCRASSSSA